MSEEPPFTIADAKPARQRNYGIPSPVASEGDYMSSVVVARFEQRQLIGSAAKVNGLSGDGADVRLGDSAGDERGEEIQPRRTALRGRRFRVAVGLHVAKVTRKMAKASKFLTSAVAKAMAN